MTVKRWVAVLGMVAGSFACGSNNSGPPPPPEQVGQPCSSAAQCYPGVIAPLSGGAAVCLDRVSGGYCTHICSVDIDCCAVPGECKTAHPQVCSPFESASAKYCFLSCEEQLVVNAGLFEDDADVYCSTYAYTGFKCRSSGGGSQNRKVCTP